MDQTVHSTLALAISLRLVAKCLQSKYAAQKKTNNILSNPGDENNVFL